MMIRKATFLSMYLLVAACATVKVSPPVLRSAMTPVYPPAAIAANHVGIAVLKVSVGADGKVSDVGIAKSSRFSELDEAALFPAHFWHFVPATSGEVAIPSTVRIPVSFFHSQDGGLTAVICQALPPSAPDNELTACPVSPPAAHQNPSVPIIDTVGQDKADLQKGYEAEQRGDYATAFALLEPFAEKGNASAQRNVGLLYRNGHGVARNDAEAVRWLSESALQGNASAQNDLGTMYLDGRGVAKDSHTASLWFKQSALQGSPFGLANLGLSYTQGLINGKIDYVVGYAMLAAARPKVESYPGYANAVKWHLNALTALMTPNQLLLGEKLAVRIQQPGGLISAMNNQWFGADYAVTDPCAAGPAQQACEQKKVAVAVAALGEVGPPPASSVPVGNPQGPPTQAGTAVDPDALTSTFQTPSYKVRNPPVYPGFEAAYGDQGTTMLLILVGTDGAPRDIKVERSSGWRNLDIAALNAAIHWRFVAEIKNAVAVEGYVRVPVAFTITPAGQSEWPQAYRDVPIEADEASISYATVTEAIMGVAAQAHQDVYTGSGTQFHDYVIYDDHHVVRELWYFTDIATDRAMAIRYTFAGTPENPVTKAAVLCDNVNLCNERMSKVLAGPYSIRVVSN
jgi:TonB family protein